MNKSIPVFDLKRLHKSIQKELDTAIQGVIDRGNFILGSEVEQFEKEFAQYIGTKYAVGVGSGTDALTLALAAHNIGSGDEVIVPANAYPTAFGVARSGATIKLIDVTDDGLINPVLLPNVITKKTKAIVAVHLYGSPVDIYSLTKPLNSTKLLIIEDAAQAHGAEMLSNKAAARHAFSSNATQRMDKAKYISSMLGGAAENVMPTKAAGWKKVGSIGDIGCFSFYPSKNLGALGDGGMVVTNNKEIARKLRQLRMYGEVSRYHSEFVSGVSRLDELQAAILRVKLRHLDTWVSQRRAIAKRYMEGFQGYNLQPTTYNLHSAFHLFVLRTKHRNKLMEYLAHHGVMTSIHYPTPIHTQKAFTSLGYKKGDFPVSEALCREVLSLPIYPHLTHEEVEYIIKTVGSFFE